MNNGISFGQLILALLIAVSFPTVMALVGILVSNGRFSDLNGRFSDLNNNLLQFRAEHHSDITNLTGAVNELDKRLTKLE